MIHWFVTNVTPYALHSAIGWLVGFLMGVIIGWPLRHIAKHFIHMQQKIANDLDTSTPGGLTELLKVSADIDDQLNTKTPGGLTDVVHAIDKLNTHLARRV